MQARAVGSELLGSLIALDSRAAFVIHAAEAAVSGPFGEHRINRVLDPYSLALYQEGRSRRDHLARSMREATLAAANHDVAIRRAREALEATERSYRRDRRRLINAVTRLRSLAVQFEEQTPNRVRARQLARRTVAEIDRTLLHIGDLGTRVGRIVREVELSWSRVREPAQRAIPAEREVRKPTERCAELMIGEVLAIELDLRRASKAVRTGAYGLEQEVSRIRSLLEPIERGP